MVFPDPAFPHCGVIYFYSNPFWAKLDSPPGHQKTLPRPPDQDHDQACRSRGSHASSLEFRLLRRGPGIQPRRRSEWRWMRRPARPVAAVEPLRIRLPIKRRGELAVLLNLENGGQPPSAAISSQRARRCNHQATRDADNGSSV